MRRASVGSGGRETGGRGRKRKSDPTKVMSVGESGIEFNDLMMTLLGEIF